MAVYYFRSQCDFFIESSDLSLDAVERKRQDRQGNARARREKRVRDRETPTRDPGGCCFIDDMILFVEYVLLSSRLILVYKDTARHITLVLRLA